MTTTTVLDRNGGSLSGDVQENGWLSYINGGGYTDRQQAILADELLDQQRHEFNERLPEDCFWSPDTSEIIGPVDAVFPEDWDTDEQMRKATEAVIGRYDAIEADAIGHTGECTVNVVDGTIIVVAPGGEDTDILSVGGRLFELSADVEPWGADEEDMDRADETLAEMGWKRVGEWQARTDTAQVCDVEIIDEEEDQR